jgi:lysophospholipase L1-like esterase
MMRKVLLLILVLIGGYSYGQVYQQMSQYGVEFKRMDNDSVLRIPRGLGSLRSISGYDTAQIRYNVSDSSVYVHTGNGWIKVVRATEADADSSVFATVHKLYTTIDSLGNLIISENLGNTNLTQSDAIRTYDGDGGELSFSNLGKFKVSASDSVVVNSSVVKVKPTSTLLVDSVGYMEIKHYDENGDVLWYIDDGGTGVNVTDGVTTSSFQVGSTYFVVNTEKINLLASDSIVINNTPSTLTTDYDVLVRDENTGKVGIATISGGADSIYQTIEIGTAPNIVGELLNESFSGTSIPATFTNPSSASVTYNNKLIVASGSGGVSDFSKYIQATSYYNFDKEEFIIKVVPKTKTSTSYGLGITFGSNAFYSNISTTSRLNLTSGADSGRVSFNTDTSSNLAFNVGDTLIYTLSVNGWNITTSVWNKTNNQRVQIVSVNQNRLGTGGRFRLCFMGGEQDITNVRIFSYNKKGGVAVFGDSQTSGTNSTIESATYPMVLQNGSKYNFSNYGYPSITTINILSGGSWINSVWNNVKLQEPDFAIIALGYNDATNGDTASFRTAYRAIIDSCLTYNITPILTTLIPRRQNSIPVTTNYNSIISSLSTQYNLKIADVFKALINKSGGTNTINLNYLSSDNVHLSDSGHFEMARAIRLVAPELYNGFVGDTTSNVKFYNLPTTESVLNQVVIDEKGRLYQVSNKISGSYIFNAANNHPYSIQRGAVSINGSIKSLGGTLEIADSVGLRIGFNGGNQYTAGTTGSNILITNAGAQGVGFPQAFPTISGTQNIFVVGRSTKTNISGGTISGNNNTFIGASIADFQNVSGSDNIYLKTSNVAITSGSGNIGIGSIGNSGITTGSYNTILSNILSYNTGVTTITNSTSGTVIIGTPYDYTGNEQPTNGEVILSGYTRGSRIYTFGAKGGIQTGVTWRAGYEGGTNVNGVNLNIQGTRGTGTGIGGAILFQTSTAGSTGTTVNTVFNNNLKIEQTGVAIASTTSAITKAASAILDVQSTTQGFLPPRMNVTQAGAIVSPAEGLIIYVTNTDGTFTTKGWWGWNGAAWEKLNN